MIDMTDSINDAPEFIVKNRMVQQTVNGISRFLILWVIMDNGPIHGYEIMSLLNEFFQDLIKRKSIRKSSPSRVYPMLKKMEDSNLITGTWHYHDNKKVKYYEITDNGKKLLFFIRDNYLNIKKSSNGSKFFDDFLNDEQF